MERNALWPELADSRQPPGEFERPLSPLQPWVTSNQPKAGSRLQPFDHPARFGHGSPQTDLG